MSPVSMATVGASSKPAAWTPASLGSALHAWYDADDAATITIATGVSQWNDKSGNARNVAQATGANQPTRVTNAKNSRAILRFDGTNDQLTGGWSLNGQASFSVNYVAWPDTVVGFRSLFVQQSGAAYLSFPWTDSAAAALDPRVILSFDGGVTTTNLTGFTSVASLILGFVRVSGGTNKMYRNGTENSTRTANASSVSGLTSANSSIGSFNNGYYYDGDLGEAVITTGTLSSTDREKLEGYLAHRWGLTSSLPAGHPYKSVAP